MSVVNGKDTGMKVAIRLRAFEKTTESNYLKVNGTDIGLTHNEMKENFTYDYVFDELSNQSKIYNGAISNLVAKSLNGFNVSILAYGQTGSGKTYTIGSSNANDNTLDENDGIISRTLRELLQTKNSKIKIKMSLLEIYKDKVIDLLDTQKGYCIIQNYHAKDLTKLDIVDISSMTIIQKGISLRKVGKTSMNDKSSRSHLMFTIYIDNLENLESSKFNIIDLAGSEKAGLDYKNCSSSKLAFEEGSFINTSLMDLRMLIKRLVGKGNVSYQANSLTKLLKDSLGSNSYTLLIACIDSRNISYQQTLDTLKFANMVKSIKNNPFKLTSSDQINSSDKSIFEELNFLREKFNKEFCDKGTSPIKFSTSHSSILVSEVESVEPSVLETDIDNEETSINVSKAMNEIDITSMKSPYKCKNVSERNSENQMNLDKLQEFLEKKRFLKVGLKEYYIDDFLSFKFEFFKICFVYLDHSPQFPNKQQFRKINKGASVIFRCKEYYSEKCFSYIRFNYINKDDSLEIQSKKICNHYQSICDNISFKRQKIY